MDRGWDFSCPDWEDRLRAGKSLVPDLPLDQAEASRAVSIFNKLRLPDVPGQPALETAAGEWFRDIVRGVFGSLDEENVRKVAEVFGLVPKKNSKTTGGAGIMMTALLMNRRPRAEFLFVGPTQEVSDLAFQQASGMIEADPDGYLPKRFSIHDHIKTIRDRRTKSFLKIKTFDMRVMTGSKPSGVLLDELHVMSSMSFATRVLGQIRGGLLPNPESFLIILTTQSDEAPAGVFKRELQYARGVRDGAVTDSSTLPILYEFSEAVQTDEDKPWKDARIWGWVNPNLNLSIRKDRLIRDYSAALQKGDDEERRWASQHLNIEIGLALHADRWSGADYWEAAGDRTITLETIKERCEVCTVGIDGGGLDDLLGLAVIGRCKTTRDWLVWTKAWCQDDVLKRRKEIAERLRDFANDGDLIICTKDDATDDIEQVADIVKDLDDAGMLPEEYGIGLDPVGVTAIVDALARRKIEGDKLSAVAQGYRLSGAIKGVERQLKAGAFWHDGSPLLTWCVGNAKAEAKGNAILITKQAAGVAKIDPLVAVFDAAMLMSRNPEPPLTSPWDDDVEAEDDAEVREAA